MAKKSPLPVDVTVGARIRMGRVIAGLSQTELGLALGVTFQQVQKYEKGANRVSASRMTQIAAAIGKPVAWLFGDGAADVPCPGADIVTRMLGAPHGLALARAFLDMVDNDDRMLVARLAERILAAAKPARKLKAA